MSLPKNISAYEHVRAVLDTALAHDRSVYTLPTPAAATRWRQEAYYFRRLSQAASIYKYDPFILKLDGSSVIIEKKIVAGVLTVEGEAVQTKPADDLPAEIEDFAFNLAKSLGLDTGDDDDNSN